MGSSALPVRALKDVFELELSVNAGDVRALWGLIISGILSADLKYPLLRNLYMDKYLIALFLILMLTYFVGHNDGVRRGRYIEHCLTKSTYEERDQCWRYFIGGLK